MRPAAARYDDSMEASPVFAVHRPAVAVSRAMREWMRTYDGRRELARCIVLEVAAEQQAVVEARQQRGDHSAQNDSQLGQKRARSDSDATPNASGEGPGHHARADEPSPGISSPSRPRSVPDRRQAAAAARAAARESDVGARRSVQASLRAVRCGTSLATRVLLRLLPLCIERMAWTAPDGKASWLAVGEANVEGEK